MLCTPLVVNDGGDVGEHAQPAQAAGSVSNGGKPVFIFGEWDAATDALRVRDLASGCSRSSAGCNARCWLTAALVDLHCNACQSCRLSSDVRP